MAVTGHVVENTERVYMVLSREQGPPQIWRWGVRAPLSHS